MFVCILLIRHLQEFALDGGGVFRQFVAKHRLASMTATHAATNTPVAAAQGPLGVARRRKSTKRTPRQASLKAVPYGRRSVVAPGLTVVAAGRLAGSGNSKDDVIMATDSSGVVSCSVSGEACAQHSFSLALFMWVGQELICAVHLHAVVCGCSGDGRDHIP